MQSVPKHMSPRTSLSLSVNSSILTGPYTTSPMSLYDYESHLSNSLNIIPEKRGSQMGDESVDPPFTLEDKQVYNSCYFLKQLEGSYWIETLAAPDQVTVFVTRVREGSEQYAIVRRICGNGDALHDQFIYQESTHFILCSWNGNVEAFLMKGSKISHSVMWEDADDGTLNVWWRKEKISSNLVHVDSLTSSLRNSACSAGSSTDVSCGIETRGLGLSILPHAVQPELLQQSNFSQIKTIAKKIPSKASFASDNGSQRNLHNQNSNPLSLNANSDHEEQAMFELIKAHCMGNSSLRKKMVDWALRNCSAANLSPKDISNISKGRLWITAHAANFTQGEEIEEIFQESLNDIKGAYKQVKTGLYKQPEPQGNDSGVQHRLRKEPQGHPFGYWKIEAYDVDSGKWRLCAKELPDGRWVDIKSSELIRVLIIPMSVILHKMGEEFVNGSQHVAKSIEFLFTSCNQKKLNTKLSRKNLRHNINNLKVRLKRQQALTFAVQVASVADAIAQELEAVE